MRRKSPSLVPGPRDPMLHSSLSLVCVAFRRRRRGREGRTGEASFTSLSCTLHYGNAGYGGYVGVPADWGLFARAPGGRWIDNWRHRNRSLHASESDCRRLLFAMSAASLGDGAEPWWGPLSPEELQLRAAEAERVGHIRRMFWLSWCRAHGISLALRSGWLITWL